MTFVFTSMYAYAESEDYNYWRSKLPHSSIVLLVVLLLFLSYYSRIQCEISVSQTVNQCVQTVELAVLRSVILFCEACRANRGRTVFSVFCARTTSPKIFRGESIEDGKSNEQPAAEHVRVRACVVNAPFRIA